MKRHIVHVLQKYMFNPPVIEGLLRWTDPAGYHQVRMTLHVAQVSNVIDLAGDERARVVGEVGRRQLGR